MSVIIRHDRGFKDDIPLHVIYIHVRRLNNHTIYSVLVFPTSSVEGLSIFAYGRTQFDSAPFERLSCLRFPYQH
jgi:hypothetical protein